VDTAAASCPRSRAEVEQFAATARFPVVAKNREPFVRRRSPAVSGTTFVDGPGELLRLARGWSDDPGVLLQEYLPREEAEDWIVHAYFDADAIAQALFTGVKVRSWPPHAGMTACAYTVGNPELAEKTQSFCKAIGFSGMADLDWRYDRRDGRYKLLDFNPRVGAQFRLFETLDGVDVVRAQHLDLTGREIPHAAQREGRRFVVENIDLQARIAYRLSSRAARYRAPHAPRRASGTEWGWFARDDLEPFLAMLARMVRPSIQYLLQALRDRLIARRKEEA
jgi:predicted ATP-grasp superfamily ATP-dependent carboligase